MEVQPVRDTAPRDRIRCLQWLGMAVRARRAVLGSDAVLAAIRNRSAQLVLLAADAGANTQKRYRDKCAFYNIPLFDSFSRDELGRACGRKECVAAAVTDPGFAAKIAELAGESDGGDAFDKTPGV